MSMISKTFLHILCRISSVNINYEKKTYIPYSGVVVVMIWWWLNLQLSVQSVPITTKVVSSNPAHGYVYPIQVCQLLAASQWISSGVPISCANKTDW